MAAFICELAGVLNEGSLSPKYGYLYIIVIMNVSVMVALFSLLVFALSTKKYLKPFGPLLKFTALKLIIFVTWWQSMVISVLVATNIISAEEDDDKTKGEIAIDLQDWLMCLEVFPFAFLMFIAYPPNLVKGKDEYDKGVSKQKLELTDKETSMSTSNDIESNGKTLEGTKDSDIEIVRKRRNNTKGGFLSSFRHALAIKDIIDDTRTYTDYQYGDFTSLGRQGDDLDEGDSAYEEKETNKSDSKTDGRSENFPASFADFDNNATAFTTEVRNEPAGSPEK